MSSAHEAHGAEHDEHGHEGNPFVQHHYDDAQHQFDSGKLGIWLFLAQEVLFFSALFVAYILYRVHHGEIYSYAHKYLDVKWGAINTAVLITSSLTAAWAVRAAQLQQRKTLIFCIAFTILCAFGFLCVKYIEYSHKVHEHILFGKKFDPCVSPGGAELLTKNNECPGAKTSIDWDPGTQTAKAGCFEDSTIDQDPHEPGLQADCKVFEVMRTPKETKGGTEWVEKSRREITNRCVEEKPWEEGTKHEESKFPCWRTGYQPAVCPDKTSVDDRSHGKPSRPQSGVIVEYGDMAERGEEFAIDAQCKPAPPAAPVPLDIFADKPEKTALGQKAIKPIHVLTTHEEHEMESMGPPPEHTGMFFTIYFAMTGLHGIHVLFGVFVFTWLLIRAVKGHFTPDYFGPVDFAALYWHIVDLIWIFLFPLLYLIH